MPLQRLGLSSAAAKRLFFACTGSPVARPAHSDLHSAATHCPMLVAARQAAAGLSAAPATLTASLQFVRVLATSSVAAASGIGGSGSGGSVHIFDEHDVIVGPYTPVTKQLWATR